MRNKCSIWYYTLLFLSIASASYSQQTKSNNYTIIPYPAKLDYVNGKFTISRETSLIVTPGAEIFTNEQGFLKQMLQNYLGAGTLKQQQVADKNAIILKYDATVGSEEGYHLSVDEKLITLSAKDPAGMFYAIETLRQLLPADVESGRGKVLQVPAVNIEDQPAFGWRGMQLDVSRHFFSLEYLRKYADMMALYKLNKLHLHLTDDQGWRIEIKKYPGLTQNGAWREFDRNDSACLKIAKETGNTDFNLDQQHIKHMDGKTLYGGYYTQDEMRSFIRYAASRHIEVIPEIDMPGHMQAAVKLYPYLTCDSTIGDGQGFSVPICPCNEKVIDFAKGIFSEIADLFPSKYIHIGGDEVDKTNWETSPASLAFMRDKGFTKPEQIQRYFNDRMIRYFGTKGKVMIGWDEITEGGIDATPVVMWWRTWAKDALLKAAKNGNEVINTADGPLYFDAIPDNHSLAAVYNYNPLDTIYHFSKENEKKIIGVQANLWSEMIPSEKRADYLLLPRMIALAELGWTHQSLYASFLQRLNEQYPRLDKLHINYRLPDVEGIAENNVFVGQTNFFKSFPSKYFRLHYTTDGSMPNATSLILEKPVGLDKTVTIRMALFTPAGRRGDVYNLQFNSQQYSPALNPSNLLDGLKCEFYKGSFKLTTDIKGTPDDISITKEVAISKTITAESFGLKFTGFMNVPETTVYTFYLNCNDGGVLKIAGKKVIDNDGLHADKEKGGQIALQKGLHAIAVDFMDGGGGNRLELRYSTGNDAPKTIPSSWFSYTK